MLEAISELTKWVGTAIDVCSDWPASHDSSRRTLTSIEWKIINQVSTPPRKELEREDCHLEVGFQWDPSHLPYVSIWPFPALTSHNDVLAPRANDQYLARWSQICISTWLWDGEREYDALASIVPRLVLITRDHLHRPVVIQLCIWTVPNFSRKTTPSRVGFLSWPKSVRLLNFCNVASHICRLSLANS